MARGSRKTVELLVVGALAVGLMMALAAQEYGEGSHHYRMRHGRVAKLWHRGEYRFATLSLEWNSGGAEATGPKEEPMQPEPGMGVMVDIRFGTASLRMPVGRVQSVSPDGTECVARLDEALLDRTVQNPTDQSTHPVRKFLVVGSEVVISTEPF